MPLLLKGSLALFTDLYEDPAERMIRDLDVLVPADAAKSALDCLERLGYRAETIYPPGHHAYADFVRANDPGAVDLHFEPIDAPHLFAASEVWRRARPLRVEGAVFLVPSPGDCVLHNLLHEQIHYLGNYYRGVLELRQLHEFATMARRYGSAVDWEAIEGRMARHRLSTPLHSYALAAQRLLALPWPLRARPCLAAELHLRRALAQLRLPALERLATPWANLRGAFAWHRMNALYRAAGFPRAAPLRHAAQFFRKKRGRAAMGRLFRTR